MIVLDANILIRAVLGRRVRQLIDTYAGQGVRFFAPDVAFDDAEKYLPPLLKKRGKPHADFSASLEYLRSIIETVTPELYAVFESEARQRLRGRDESDWPILATALGLACAVWTEDTDFFGTGVAVWTKGYGQDTVAEFARGRAIIVGRDRRRIRNSKRQPQW
jgi:predicted nucleic acid-binding protein